MVTHSNELALSGRRYDKYGNMVDWWGNSSAQQFTSLAQCFIDEYNTFQVYGNHVCYLVYKEIITNLKLLLSVRLIFLTSKVRNLQLRSLINDVLYSVTQHRNVQYLNNIEV